MNTTTKTSKGFRVGDEYRTSNKSLTPGGVTVCVKRMDGKVMEYDRVKIPYSYIRALKNNGGKIKAWWIKDE